MSEKRYCKNCNKWPSNAHPAQLITERF